MNEFRALPRRLQYTFATLIFVAVFAMATTVLLSHRVRTLQSSNTASVGNAELTSTVAAVGKVLLLPENEVPTLATVSDVSKLQGQPFFAHAQAGDKVLIYATARKAILWRPSEGKVIEVSAINPSI